MTEDEMVGWHHRLNGHDLSKLWETVKDGKPGVLYVTHGVTELNMTEQLNKQQIKYRTICLIPGTILLKLGHAI